MHDGEKSPPRVMELCIRVTLKREYSPLSQSQLHLVQLIHTLEIQYPISSASQPYEVVAMIVPIL